MGILKALVADKSPEFDSGDLKPWHESLGFRKMELHFYRPGVIRLAERAVKTVMLALRAWSSKLNFIWIIPEKWTDDPSEHFKDDVQYSSWTSIKTQSEDNNKIGFDWCEPLLFRANEKTRSQSL